MTGTIILTATLAMAAPADPFEIATGQFIGHVYDVELAAPDDLTLRHFAISPSTARPPTDLLPVSF